MRRAIAVSIGLLFMGGIFAHANQDTDAFEVASIRRQPQTLNPGLIQVRPQAIVIENLPLRRIIQYAYSIDSSIAHFVVVGGPDEVLDAQFDVLANAPGDGPTGRPRLLAMLRTLLTDRFSLLVHQETRRVPIYLLTRRRETALGPDLRPSASDCEAYRAARREVPGVAAPADPDDVPLCANNYGFNTPTPGALTLREAGPLDLLVRRIQPFLDRPVVNMTGIEGSFEWTVSFSRDPYDTDMPSIFVALQRQLGLTLEGGTGPFDVLVIDTVSLPTAN